MMDFLQHNIIGYCIGVGVCLDSLLGAFQSTGERYYSTNLEIILKHKASYLYYDRYLLLQSSTF